MADAGLSEPEFDPNGFFVAIFRRAPEFALKQARRAISDRPTQNTAQETIQNTAQTTDQKIIALIERRPDVTRQELAKAIGITDSGVKYQLKRMQERELIRRVGPDRGGHWEVIRGPNAG